MPAGLEPVSQVCAVSCYMGEDGHAQRVGSPASGHVAAQGSRGWTLSFTTPGLLVRDTVCEQGLRTNLNLFCEFSNRTIPLKSTSPDIVST